MLASIPVVCANMRNLTVTPVGVSFPKTWRAPGSAIPHEVLDALGEFVDIANDAYLLRR